ncbi:MAG: TetR/AcrR family transcriptional regulator, partial [Pseudomonadota bacterium]
MSSDQKSMRERILDAAERRMRAAGYNAMSFRDVATDVGVKSASVHYHFPSKEDLGVALVDRYAARQFDELAAATEGVSDAEARVAAMIDLHKGAFVEGKSICLCAMLSAESVGLPERVTGAVKDFFDGSLEWLEETFAGDASAKTRAEAVLAALQGGMLVAAVARDRSHFDRAAKGAAALAAAPL